MDDRKPWPKEITRRDFLKALGLSLGALAGAGLACGKGGKTGIQDASPTAIPLTATTLPLPTVIPLTVPPQQLWDAPIDLTLVGGKVVYQRT
jgi:hypothetical protein